MKESIYKNYDELPLFMNAETVSKVLGISISTAYEIMHEKGFRVFESGIGSSFQKANSSNGLIVKRKDKGFMDYKNFSNRDPIGHFFMLPNEIFYLGLSGGEILVYSFLMRCEDRKTYKCYPRFGYEFGQLQNWQEISPIT